MAAEIATCESCGERCYQREGHKKSGERTICGVCRPRGKEIAWDKVPVRPPKQDAEKAAPVRDGTKLWDYDAEDLRE